MDSDLVQKIKHLIAEKGTNPSALSLEVGMGRQYVRDLLEGRTKSPSLEGAARIAKALGVSVAYLAGETDSPPAMIVDGSSIAVTIPLYRAEQFSSGLSDLLCWCRGFRAALPQDATDREPFGDWAAREVNILLKSAIDKGNAR